MSHIWIHPGLKRVEVKSKGHTCRESALVLVVTLQFVLIMCDLMEQSF